MRKMHHGNKPEPKKLSDQLDVNAIGNSHTMITWTEKDGRFNSVVIPDAVLPSLVKRLATWMDV